MSILKLKVWSSTFPRHKWKTRASTMMWISWLSTYIYHKQWYTSYCSVQSIYSDWTRMLSNTWDVIVLGYCMPQYKSTSPGTGVKLEVAHLGTSFITATLPAFSCKWDELDLRTKKIQKVFKTWVLYVNFENWGKDHVALGLVVVSEWYLL